MVITQPRATLPADLGASVELDLAVRSGFVDVAGIVDLSVVESADHHAAFDVGPAALGPLIQVVEMGVAGPTVATLDDAGLVPEGDRDALRLGVEPGLAAEVQHLGPGADHRGDDSGLARQPAGGSCGDGFAGVEQRGGLEAAEQ